MSRRVEVDAKTAILSGLMFVPGCSGGEHGGFGRVDVGHGDVEVELLGVGAARPRRRDVVVDPLKGEGGPTIRTLGAHPAARRDERRPVVVDSVLERQPSTAE